MNEPYNPLKDVLDEKKKGFVLKISIEPAAAGMEGEKPSIELEGEGSPKEEDMESKSDEEKELMDSKKAGLAPDAPLEEEDPEMEKAIMGGEDINSYEPKKGSMSLGERVKNDLFKKKMK